MHYSDSLRYLDSFINFEKFSYHPGNRRWNLDRMHYLVKLFRHPEKDFFPVLIAGTKGKGSTGFFLEAILRHSGISAGFYSSPHLEDPRERIRINGQMISKKRWCQGLGKIRAVLTRHPAPSSLGEVTYFEIMTLLAMLTFQEERVKIGIFEIGMGGRLDATNVMDAKLVILTPVYLDHEAFLGNTVKKIAGEKAAIIRPGAYVVMSPQMPEAGAVIQKVSKEKSAYLFKGASVSGLPIGLSGRHQKDNAGSALRAAQILRDVFKYLVTDKGIREGLRQGDWPGRFESMGGGALPFYILDGAHNPSSIQALVRHLQITYPNRERILIFGTSRDKRSDLMLKRLASYFKQVILTPLPNSRSQDVSVLLAQARGLFSFVMPAGNIGEAMDWAAKVISTKGMVVGTGSFYLIGEMRKILRKRSR